MRRLVVLAALLGAAPSVAAEPLKPPAPAPTSSSYEPSRSLAPLVKAVVPAVIAIEVVAFEDLHPSLGTTVAPRIEAGEGSGFIISPDGLVLTNHHVVARATTIKARFADGTRVDLVRLGGDADMDVALLRLAGDREWPYLELGKSSATEVGDWVVAIGNPLGLGHTVTAGIISGKGRVIGSDLRFATDDFIQTDAAINEGNSGGPLFNVDGQVIGINTAIIAGANTVGFAIPIDMVSWALDDLRTAGRVRRGYMGVDIDDLATTRDGAVIATVHPGTPAEAAGLNRGDVVVRVGEQLVADHDDFRRSISTHRPGDAIVVELVRDGEKTEVLVTLGERPDPNDEAKRRRKQP